MTTCIRSLPKFCLHSKFIAGRRHSAPVLLIGRRTHSQFMNEFLDASVPPPSLHYIGDKPSTCIFPVQTTSHCSLTTLTAKPVDILRYDQFMEGLVVVKPLETASDDIILRCGNDNSSTEWCDKLIAEDLEMDVIQREMFLAQRLPSSISSKVWAWHQNCTPLTDFEKRMILSVDSNVSSTEQGTPKVDPSAKPSDEHLERIFLSLSSNLPNFFTKPQDYRIYHDNLVFHNNIRGVTTIGLVPYIRQLSILRVLGHLKFAYVRMEVLKITKHPEDGTIRVRWRIRGVPGLKIILQFWKYKVWNVKSMFKKESDWYDGFSTFYVGGDGFVHKHVCDKMMPDEQREKTVDKTNLAAKLALLLGAIPRPSLEELSDFSLALAKLQGLQDDDFVTMQSIKW